MTHLSGIVTEMPQKCSHLSVALSVDVDGRRRHYSGVLHLPGVRAALENSVVVPAAEKSRTEKPRMNLIPGENVEIQRDAYLLLFHTGENV